MTALHKGQPRYVVAAVTGYTITPGYHESNSRVEMTSYSVLDRAYCHREVAIFNAKSGRRALVCAERARLVCDALNAEEPLPWWDHLGKPHHGPLIEPARRGNERKFDWAEAARLYDEGTSIRRLAADLGVSSTAIRNAIAWAAQR
jgi:hypothetical protein